MARESDYSIGNISNDLIGFWEDEGYEEEGNNLTSPMQLPIRVSKFRRDDSVIALVRQFGRALVERADGIVINGIEMLPIVRNDFRVETTGILEPDDIANVELIIDGEIYSDKIPIVDVEFETFVKGTYKSKRETRTIVVDATKSVRLGIRHPTGTNATQFWDKVFRTLETNVLTEFVEGISIEKSFEHGTEDLASFTWEIIQGEGDFPRNAGELRESL
ncbi:MAG: hypothetical protein AABX29_07715 [Nanoarchaeota archaeon]